MIEKICEDSLISIIMPAYNAEDFLDETIQSVLKQTYQKWELVVVNDASQDSTLQILERYMALDSRIKVYSLTKNSGACVALNEALKRTSGEYICWLSADDKYKKEMLCDRNKSGEALRMGLAFCLCVEYTEKEIRFFL